MYTDIICQAVIRDKISVVLVGKHVALPGWSQDDHGAAAQVKYNGDHPMKFRKKPVVVEAITFDELVAHGLTQTEGIRGIPWSFDYEGHPITHEYDECYLIPTLEGTMNFTPGDMLITGVSGEIYPCKLDIFEKTYEPVDN